MQQTFHRTEKRCDMKVTKVAIIIGVLRTIPKAWVNGLEDLEGRGRSDTIQSTAL